MKLSEKIIKLRKEKGLSQEDFGNAINVSRQAVSKWENEEAKPDIDKIQEIVKKFNISYEYLLNDEIETIENPAKNFDNTKSKTHKLRGISKTIFIIFIIYFLICVYKFATFYKFYLIANSFSEENYLIYLNENYSISSNKTENIAFETTKVGNKILKTSRSNTLKDETGKIIPYSITYTDIDKKEHYSLIYNEEKGKYIYSDETKSAINAEEREELFKDKNEIKESTLNNIPSNFKEIFLASINPMFYYVDIVNHEFRCYSIADRADKTVKLSNDYLIENVHLNTKSGTSLNMSYSYDYVQEHLKDFENPLDIYENKIIFEEE